MNTPLPLDAAELDALNVYSGSISDASLLNGHYTFGQVRALVRQSRAALTLAARVAELEKECVRLSECVAAERMNAMTHASHTNALRDALEKIAKRVHTDGCDMPDLRAQNEFVYRTADKALASTPAASLAALKAEVLERAIKAIEAPEGECEGLADCESNFGDAYSSGFDDGLRSARNSVRALAAQAQEVKP